MENYGKLKEKEKAVCKLKNGFGSRLSVSKVLAPHNTSLTTVPLIKMNNDKYSFLECLIFIKK